MTICPCCGFKFEGNLLNGCAGCGARAVGAPLPKPDHELPAYGRSLLLTAAGTLMVLGFLGQTVAALVQNSLSPFGFWTWVASAETAAWRLKWIAIPIALVVLVGGRFVYRSMLKTPRRFIGLTTARRSLTASALVILTIAGLIVITVPDRLRQRRVQIEAQNRAVGLTFSRAYLEYSNRYNKVPAYVIDLRKLPDPDGSIAAALATLPNVDDPSGYAGYKPSTELAAADETPPSVRPTVFRRASSRTTDELSTPGVSFTKYELRLPGEDKILFTDDDIIVTNGIVETANQAGANRKP